MNQVSDKSVPPELESVSTWRKTLADYGRSGCHVDLGLDVDQLLPAVKRLYDTGYFLEDITGVDLTEGIMLVYHFDRYDTSRRVVMRLTVPHTTPKAPSIASVYSGADWHERECFDFFGVEFEGHPGLKPLLLPDDLGVHPLIKDKGRQSIFALLPLEDAVDRRA
jgi:NADH-quinone oxidoreductase subunit C